MRKEKKKLFAHRCSLHASFQEQLFNRVFKQLPRAPRRTCPCLLSVAVIKATTKISLMGKNLFGFHVLIRVHHLGSWAGTRSKGHGGTLLTGLLLVADSVHCPIQLRAHLSKGASTYNGRDAPTSLTNQDNVPQAFPQATLLAFSQLRFLCPDDQFVSN